MRNKLGQFIREKRPNSQTGSYIKCKNCGKSRYYKKSYLLRGYGIYCSVKCMSLGYIGKPPTHPKTGKYIKCALSTCNKTKYFKYCLLKLSTKRYCSKEHKFESMQGHIPWNKGKELPRGLEAAHWKGGKPNCQICGKKLSTYTSIKCKSCNDNSLEMKERLLKGRIKQQTIDTPTSIEKILYDYLKLKKIKFVPQKRIEFYLVDAYIPSLNLVIEADGDYWHALPETKWRDKSKNTYLKNRGYNLIRLSEIELLNGEFKQRLGL